jgi:hypothetical protein
MFDYAHRMQLAVSDLGRRVAYKAVAAVLALVAAGFLIAALWTLFARTFDWGPLWASVAVAVLFGAGAGILLAMSKTVKHPVPSTDDLKREVEARVSLAAEAGMDRAKEKAREVVDHAENKVHGLIDKASYKAAEVVESAEAKVQQFTKGTVAQASSKLGFDGGPAEQLLDKVSEVSRSRAGPAIGLAGAFILGIALASRLGQHDEGDWVEDDSEDWDEDIYA